MHLGRLVDRYPTKDCVDMRATIMNRFAINCLLFTFRLKTDRRTSLFIKQENQSKDCQTETDFFVYFITFKYFFPQAKSFCQTVQTCLYTNRHFVFCLEYAMR